MFDSTSVVVAAVLLDAPPLVVLLCHSSFASADRFELIVSLRFFLFAILLLLLLSC